MKPFALTDTQGPVGRIPTQQEKRVSPSGKSDMDGKYPRELNKGGIVVSMLISVIVMVVLLVSIT